MEDYQHHTSSIIFLNTETFAQTAANGMLILP